MARYFQRMEAAGYKPKESAYTAMLLAFNRKGETRKMQKWFDRMISEGVKPYGFTIYLIVDAYAKEGNLAAVCAPFFS